MSRVSLLYMLVISLATSLTLSAQSAGMPSGASRLPASAVNNAPAPRAAVGARVADPRNLPGTNQSAFATIKGNTLDNTGTTMPNSAVRLRDARSGRIVDQQVSDDAGYFEFRSVDPGSYIVEMLANNQTITAASQILSVDAGDAISALVKLPFKIPPFGGLLGHTTASAVVVAGAAASAGVLTAAVTLEATPE